jgi:hypothetical protein
MEFQKYKTVNIDAPEFDGPLQVEALLTFERALYGVDADGRRGEWKDYLTYVEIESVYDLETGRDITGAMNDKMDALVCAVRKDL